MPYRFSKEQNNYMLELHQPSNPDPLAAQKLFWKKYGDYSVSAKTILNRWKEHKKKINPRGGKRHGFSDDEFKELYDKCRGNLARIGVLSKQKRSYLEIRCKRLHLPIDPD